MYLMMGAASWVTVNYFSDSLFEQIEQLVDSVP